MSFVKKLTDDNLDVTDNSDENKFKNKIENLKVCVCGVGVVGTALVKAFEKRKIILTQYDKYKKNGKIDNLLSSDLVFLCLPTLYDDGIKEYNKKSLYEICSFLDDNEFQGLCIIKSTIEPGTCRKLERKYNLKIIHNPEFLTARTANKDFNNQKHIVLGYSDKMKMISDCVLEKFYKFYWGKSEISKSVFEESEIMKIGINSFYAVKIQFLNEIYLLSNKYNIDFDKIIQMMLKNKWISENHTKVPGTDGKLSYGGMCFPKDTNALYQTMLKSNIPCKVLEATIKERNEMRDD